MHILTTLLAEDPSSGGGSSFLIPMIVIGVIFWFIVIGPERKQRKKREAMLASLEKGAKVMTTGGLYGTIATVGDDVITLQVADGVRLRFARSAIQGIVGEEKKPEAKETTAKNA